jgi:hypothetical protein
MDDAVAFGQFPTAQRLVERRAHASGAAARTPDTGNPGGVGEHENVAPAPRSTVSMSLRVLRADGGHRLESPAPASLVARQFDGCGGSMLTAGRSARSVTSS